MHPFYLRQILGILRTTDDIFSVSKYFKELITDKLMQNILASFRVTQTNWWQVVFSASNQLQRKIKWKDL